MKCPGSYANIATGVSADSTFYDDVLAQAGTYAYRVQACNVVGCSAYAATASVVVP
jgi:hypothetical protein